MPYRKSDRRRNLLLAIVLLEGRLERYRAEVAALPPPPPKLGRGGGARPLPVLHGATRFASVREAARHEGVTPVAITYRVRRGIDGWRYAETPGRPAGEART